MRRAIGLVLLGLAGCGDAPKETPQVATAAQDRSGSPAPGATPKTALVETRFEPGEWRVETSVRDVTAEGLPPEAVRQMKVSMANVAGETQCLSPEDAAKPAAELFTGKKRGNCTYDSFTLRDGKLKATLSCPDTSGAKMAMTMDGDFSKTTYLVDSTMRIQSLTPGQGLTVTMRTKGERTGPCRAPASG